MCLPFGQPPHRNVDKLALVDNMLSGLQFEIERKYQFRCYVDQWVSLVPVYNPIANSRERLVIAVRRYTNSFGDGKYLIPAGSTGTGCSLPSSL